MNEQPAEWEKPLDLLNSGPMIKICAPMVRYSKQAFRHLVRKYGVDIAYTPMIVSDSFVRSQKARDAEFTTGQGDRPLIVQFAANNATDLANAAELVYRYSDGVDLNCGCPQRKTVDFCQKLEAAGVSFITVHGRTKDQRSEPVNIDAIRTVKDSLQIPVVANGDVTSKRKAEDICQATGVNGVMAARGMLDNPAMFSGFKHTPAQCVQDWLQLSAELGCPLTQFHHHLMFMLDRVLSRSEKRIFNALTSYSAIVDYLHTAHSVDLYEHRGRVLL
ncbi:tRNA-dihydrouridine(20a/20b) synthase [NAD(P)+]-like isoform X2 [Dermacentor albipictus]|uniref:tRNA-dihydrouridine(20a/20b) synthase [NAD(P)+]-like isoform X2 n=1 Tax=Dermacentor albipictus TaxID=60249 RepID=UPI0038FD3807